jgi:hypothetical protein
VTEPVASVAITPIVHEPVLESSVQSVYSLDPRSAEALPVNVVQGDSQGAAYYSGAATETQVAKTDVTPGSKPRLFDTSSLFGGHLATLAAAARVTGVQDGTPHPLLPFELPWGAGAPPVGSTFAGSSGVGLGLEFLAILALLSLLSRLDGSRRSPRDVFSLVSSPRLVTELPG